MLCYENESSESSPKKPVSNRDWKLFRTIECPESIMLNATIILGVKTVRCIK